MTIVIVPPYPQRNSPTFADEADSWNAQLPTWTSQVNATAVDVTNKQIAAAASEVAAELAETNAKTAKNLSIANASGSVATGSSIEWANKTTGVVAGGEYSSKEYAIGTNVAAGSAKDWATQTGSAVDGTEYSAKEYASGTVSPTGSSKEWANTPEDVVVAGGEYSSKHYSLKTQTLKTSVEATAAAVQSAAGLPSLVGNAFKSLSVNSAETGVEWSGGVTPGAEYITASKTFVVPANVKLMFVQVWGAGGGGAASSVTSFYPAGGGGYSEKYIAVTPGESIVATVGIGGLGGVWVSSPGANGAAGGTTSFGSYLSATGGGPALAVGAVGQGGLGSGGSLNVNGGAGLAIQGGGSPGAGFMFPGNINSADGFPKTLKNFISCGGYSNQNASGTQGGDGLIIVRWYK